MVLPCSAWAQKANCVGAIVVTMSVKMVNSLRNVGIATVAGTDGRQIPLLSDNSPIKHYESWNWHSFGERCRLYSLEHPATPPPLVCAMCPGLFENTNKRKTVCREDC